MHKTEFATEEQRGRLAKVCPYSCIHSGTWLLCVVDMSLPMHWLVPQVILSHVPAGAHNVRLINQSHRLQILLPLIEPKYRLQPEVQVSVLMAWGCAYGLLSGQGSHIHVD